MEIDGRKLSVSGESLYAILELPKGASADDIRRSFERLALQFHPDRNSGDPKFEERFKEINRANAILSNETKRKIYNSYGSLGVHLVEQQGWLYKPAKNEPDAPTRPPSHLAILYKVFCGALALFCCTYTCCCCCCCCNFCCGKCKPTCECTKPGEESLTTQPTSERTESATSDSETTSLMSPPESSKPTSTDAPGAKEQSLTTQPTSERTESATSDSETSHLMSPPESCKPAGADASGV